MAPAHRIRALVILGVLFLIAGCTGAGRLSFNSSPHEQYEAMLRASGLNETSLGAQWATADELALGSAAPIASPFIEFGYFAAGQPTAVAYRLELQRGRRLAIAVTFETSEPGRLFVDLFRSEMNSELRRVASLEADSHLLEYDVDRTAAYVLRLQPSCFEAVASRLSSERSRHCAPSPSVA